MINRPNGARNFQRYRIITTTTILLVLSTYMASVLLWPLQAISPQVAAYPRSIPATTTPSWPTQYSAIGTAKDGVLASSSNERVPIASITKVITSLVILDAKPIQQGKTGSTITLTPADAQLYNSYVQADGSVAPASAGMRLSQYQLLQGMLMVSANNYADAAAVWAFGSMDAYLTAAKTYLDKHGLRGTTVADATGFSPNSTSTPSDLIKIGVLAVSDPVISTIVSQKTAIIPGVGTFTNTNRLLGTRNVIGIKTGTTDEAGSCLLFAAQIPGATQPTTLVGVVLDAPSHADLFAGVGAFLDTTVAQFTDRTVALPADTKVASYTTPWGDKTAAYTPSVATFAWQGLSSSINAQPKALQPEDTAAGTVTVRIGGQKISKDLTLDKPLTKPSAWWRITHPKIVFGL
jgi:serine-type D-Ala-D-Ala carboxypeptidase (penicillin-binding protein 5/6)